MESIQALPKFRRPHFYWWTLANILATCLAILSWLVTVHIFSHPEVPQYYKLLKKLHRAQAPPGFELQEAPPGEAAAPPSLYRRYAQLDPVILQKLNQSLLRNYLTGLKEIGLIQYIEGDFQVIRTRELNDQDLFSKGFIVRTRAMVQPDEFSKPTPWPIIIDFFLPTKNVAAREWFHNGDDLKVSKIPNCIMIVNVQREIEGDTPRLVISGVPIVMGEYEAGEEKKFSLDVPEELEPAAIFPAFEPEPEPKFDMEENK